MKDEGRKTTKDEGQRAKGKGQRMAQRSAKMIVLGDSFPTLGMVTS